MRKRINIEYLDGSSKYDTNIVYMLQLMKDNEPKAHYIGQTTRQVGQRILEHTNLNRRCAVSDSIVANRIDTIKVRTFTPHPWESLDQTERRAIKAYSHEETLINKIKYKKSKYN